MILLIVAYCWAESPTQSFGSYIGNASVTEGPVIECGFEPAFVLIKSANLGTDWTIVDSARNPSNSRNSALFPNSSDAEETSNGYNIEFTSTGFQVLASSAVYNGGGDTYIYAAFGNSFDATVLELTDDTGLTEFSPGDAVIQNSGGAPVSSAITNVEDVNNSFSVAGTDNGYKDDGKDSPSTEAMAKNAFDGNPNTFYGFDSPNNQEKKKGWDLNTNNYITVPVGTTIEVIGSGSWGGTAYVRFYAGDIAPYKCDVNTGPQTYAEPKVIRGLVAEQAAGNNYYGNITTIKVGGKALVWNEIYTELVLEDDTNLANFRVGDVVGGTYYLPVDNGTSASGGLLIDTGYVEGTTLPMVWTLSLETPVNARYVGMSLIFGNQAATEALSPSSVLTIVSVNGVANGAQASSGWVPDTQLTNGIAGNFRCTTADLGSVQLISSVQIRIENNLPGNTPVFGGFLLSADNSSVANKLLPTNVGGVTALAINEATPSIATDGGTWNIGDPVTAPAQVAATGTVSSVDAVANTMTLSTSDGRWLVTEPGYQEDLKLNKKADSADLVVIDNAELFCIFDAEGNISDLSASDPGFKDMLSDGSTSANFNLTFPALLPSMETPDERLPKGTTLCVNAKATNAIGVALSEEACVTPIEGDGPTSSMHGLRFDPDRDTSLANTLSTDSSWTIATWVKPGATAGYVVQKYVDTDNQLAMYWTGSQLEMDNGSSDRITAPLTSNTWSHVVWQNDNGTVTIYVNGTSIATTTGYTPLASSITVVGASHTLDYSLDGYLSEFYTVDGQALPPTAFGYDYENQGKWAPLENTVIKQNITDAGGFGANGFYLPFNPAAVGEIFSPFLTAPNGTIYGNEILSFNGDTSTWTTTLDSDTLVFAPTEPIVVNTSFGYYVPDSPYVQWIRVSLDGASVDLNVSSTLGLYFISEFVGKTISSSTPLTVQAITSTRTECNFGSLAIDGVLLLDHNSIGVDDSGNENNFSDQNFAVGNTSQVWSNYLTGLNTVYTPQSTFDGNTATAAQDWNGVFNETTSYALTFTPTTPITFTDKVEVYSPGAPQAPYSNTLSADLGSGFGAAIPVVQNSWITVATGGGVLTAVKAASQQNGAPISAIRIDGVLLIDANIQDTVTDTPLLAYSVLDVGANGNLVGTQPNFDLTLTWQGNAGTNYYYEANGSGEVHPGGTAFASQTDVVYNFGQQPFADVGPQGDEETLFQTWEQWNNVATLNAANPASVLVFNAIKTAVETYEGDCAECRQEVINSLVKIVASGVLTNTEETHLAKFMRTLIN